MPRQISPRTTLDSLKTEAKRWLKALRAGDAGARARLVEAIPDAPPQPTLRDVQHALAREYGAAGWHALRNRLATDAPIRRYEAVVDALVTAYRENDEAARRIVWEYFGHSRAWDALRRYVRLDLGRPEQPRDPEDAAITVDEARYLVARAQGFETWSAFADWLASTATAGASLALKPAGAYTLDDSGERQPVVRTRDWDELFARVRSGSIPGLHANGQMTDALLPRVAGLTHVEALDFGGSRHVTDRGIRHLAKLTRLRHLNLAGTGISDGALEVLRHLPALESINLAWTAITDAGARHLAACRGLRTVSLDATATGDGAIHALAGMQHLCSFRSGTSVSDEGITALHRIPVFKTWHGGTATMGLTSADAQPNYLLLRGSFTDAGLAQLVGLDGLFALNLDDSRLRVTGAGLAPLAALPHLEWLAFDATDEAMPSIASLPHLRFLMCQDTIAGDDGFMALSRSRTLEYIWGRRCYNLHRRGFTALANIPTLRALSVSCRNVDDAGLSALPRFPSLTELMPMDVPDEGYRHIGRCARLESLVLMYCRDTTDAATEHIRSLTRLKKYFASYTRITDRTPEILSGIPSLEEITFDTCMGVTDRGIAALERLPRLRALHVSGMPGVSQEQIFALQSIITLRCKQNSSSPR
jgi:Leucine Rich repeat